MASRVIATALPSQGCPNTGSSGDGGRRGTPAVGTAQVGDPVHDDVPPGARECVTASQHCHALTRIQTVQVCMISAFCRRAVSTESKTSSGLMGFTPSIMSISRMP